ncbi:AraC family transcriptional regulator [Flavobacterium sp. WW92]|uniref:helix-turn-helix transcriptional regulator n=1 Tax=unclassified Flavobacterium TaxID=196869 RepID=UPI0022244F5C|nr:MULTISPECIES: AraC family transcriptional regulator [unclassified Flavobacterium]WDO12319.1 AraC family transcriptional regulator [Flavobacterium sp. WW92]
MHQEKNIRRLHAACQMLLELAAGNYSFRADRSQEDDLLEVLLTLLNLMAEHGKDALLHKGYVNPHKTYSYIIQEALLLDRQGNITGHTAALPALLVRNDLVGLPVEKLIETRDLSRWEQAFAELTAGHLDHLLIPIEFSIPLDLVFTPLCAVSRLAPSDNLLIGFIVPEPPAAESPGQESVAIAARGTESDDAELMQKVYDFVLTHQEGPFPKIRALARMFSTNEFKLKSGFQHYFRTSIYQLYNEQRLKKAFLLIRYSKKALKDIAYTVGFTTYSNFARAFKIKFGCGPGEIPRRRFGQ